MVGIVALDCAGGTTLDGSVTVPVLELVLGDLVREALVLGGIEWKEVTPVVVGVVLDVRGRAGWDLRWVADRTDIVRFTEVVPRDDSRYLVSLTI